jgi:hypothetical protein
LRDRADRGCGREKKEGKGMKGGTHVGKERVIASIFTKEVQLANLAKNI